MSVLLLGKELSSLGVVPEAGARLHPLNRCLSAVMVTCPLAKNFRACCEQRPPLVTFILCLVSLAMAFGGFGAYIHSHEVKNPDITEDWNTFLQSLSQFLFCLPTNGTDDLSPNLWPTGSPVLHQASTPEPSEGWVTVTLLAGLAFHSPGAVGEVWIPNRAHLRARISGLQLGLTGPDAKEMMNLTAAPWQPHGCGGEVSCLLSEISASCITVTAPASLLPTTRKPPDCGVHPSKPLLHPSATAEPQSEGPREKPFCYQVEYRWDPTLTSMLSEVERLLCRGHLLLASCALFLVAGSLCCLGAVCTHPAREKRLRVHL